MTAQTMQKFAKITAEKENIVDFPGVDIVI